MVWNLLMFISLTFAETASPSPQGGLTPLIPLILIIGIFYFLVIRPQQRKAREHQKFVTEMKRGDLVVTSSGIIGSIRALSDKFVTLEVDNGVCLKILKGQISENANALKEEAKKSAPTTVEQK